VEDEVAPQQPYDVVGHRQPDESLSGKGKVGLAERHQRVHQIRDDPLLSQRHYEMCQKYHLTDPAHEEKFPDPACFWVVELIAEGGGKAEIVEVAHSQVVRIFQEALLTLGFLVTAKTLIFLQLRSGHAGFLAEQPSRVWRATPSINLDVADQFKEHYAVEAGDKYSGDEAKVKKVDEDHGKQDEETEVEAVEDKPIGRGYESFRHRQLKSKSNQQG